jgi:hypothetical protein
MASISLALLADYATATESGADRVHVIGGGIRSLAFTAFPAVRSRLALALGLEFSSDEARTGDHSVRIEPKGPGDVVFQQPISASFSFRPDRLEPEGPVYFHFVYNMENVTFPDVGTYSFTVIVDDQSLGAVDLRVSKAAGPLPRATAAARKLNEGYGAFAAGDLPRAQAIFEEVVRDYPEVPGGHNNLGFVLLERGAADEALAAFLRARELGFSQPELLDANIGCTYYVQGNPAAAALLFEQCLRVYGFRGAAMLYGIDGSRLFTVHLQSASDYVSLMLLNASWSAVTSGDQATASRYAAGAFASELATREDESGKNFALSLQNLGKKIG